MAAIGYGGSVIADSQTRVWRTAGAPTNGTSGTFAGKTRKGDLLIDTTNGTIYVNTNTAASPTWTGIPANGNLDAGDAGNVANANTTGGLAVLFRIDVAAGVTGDVDVTLDNKVRVVDAWLVKKAAAGGGAGTIQVKNGATAITDAMSIDVADKTVVRAATIDDAQWEVAAAGTLRVTRTRTASTDETCTVYVLAIPVA